MYFVCAWPPGKSFAGSGGMVRVRSTSTATPSKTMFMSNGDGLQKAISASPARGAIEVSGSPSPDVEQHRCDRSAAIAVAARQIVLFRPVSRGRNGSVPSNLIEEP